MDDTNKVAAEVQRLLLSPSCDAVDITQDKDGGILKEFLNEGDSFLLFF